MSDLRLGSARLGEVMLPITHIWFEHGDVMVACEGVGPLPADSGVTTYYGRDGEVVSVSEIVTEIPAVSGGQKILCIGQIRLTGHRERMRQLQRDEG